MSDQDDARRVIEWDWVQTFNGYVLHYPLTGDIDVEMYYVTDAKLACGRQVKWASIPGMFSRLSVERCDLCCKALGYPYGVGSPKNDDACRPLVEARLQEPTP